MSAKKNKQKSYCYRRRTVNAWSFILTCLIMVIGLKIADGTFTHKMNKMSENLDRALDKVIESGKPNCTILEVIVEYKSDTKFNAKGMAGLYNVSKKFMDLIIPANFIPKGKKLLLSFFNFCIGKFYKLTTCI